MILTKSLLLLLLATAAPKPATVDDLGWLSGTWSATDNGVVTEEIWSTPGGGMILGMHRDVGPKRASFEFFRIGETPEGLTYFAQPSGRPPTPFRMTASTPNRVVFENPEHDFPKRITYWREGTTLCASVDGGGHEEKWCWTKK